MEDRRLERCFSKMKPRVTLCHTLCTSVVNHRGKGVRHRVTRRFYYIFSDLFLHIIQIFMESFFGEIVGNKRDTHDHNTSYNTTINKVPTP